MDIVTGYYGFDWYLCLCAWINRSIQFNNWDINSHISICTAEWPAWIQQRSCVTPIFGESPAGTEVVSNVGR